MPTLPPTTQSRRDLPRKGEIRSFRCTITYQETDPSRTPTPEGIRSHLRDLPTPAGCTATEITVFPGWIRRA